MELLVALQLSVRSLFEAFEDLVFNPTSPDTQSSGSSRQANSLTALD
jgi:hypothetical protein